MLVIFMMSLKWTNTCIFSRNNIVFIYWQPLGVQQENLHKLRFHICLIVLDELRFAKIIAIFKANIFVCWVFPRKCIENTQVSLHNNSFVKGDYLHDIVFPLMVMTSVGSLLLQLWKKSFKNSTRLNLSELTFTDIFMTLILRKKTNKDASSLLTALSTVLWLNFTEVRLLTVDTVVNLTDFYNSAKLQSVVWLS